MPLIEVENPQPAGCSDSRMDLLTVAPGPTIASAEPALLCTEDGSREITIRGTGFLDVDGTLPMAMVGGMPVASVDSVSNCDPLTVNGLDVQTCSRLVVTVAQGALTNDTRPEVVVVNPDPAGCMASDAEVLTVPPLLAIAMANPVNVCKDKVDPAFPVTVTGAGFLRVDGTDPSLTIAGEAVTPDAFGDCTDLEVAGLDAGDAQTCGSIDATIDLTAALTADTSMPIPIELSNAGAAPACPLSAMTAIQVVEPPNVTGVDIVSQADDMNVCSDIGFDVTVTGMNFVEGAVVKFISQVNMTEVLADSVTVDSDTMITASFPMGLPYDDADSVWDLIVENAGDCGSVPDALLSVTVNPSPLVFFVDPPVVYNDISIDVTVFTANLSMASSLDTIEIVDSSDVATELTVVDNPKPNRIVANIPGSGTFAAGDYTIRVTSILGCEGELAGGLTVTDTLNNALLTSIAPSYVSPTVPTAVTIEGSGMIELPRLYLTPSSGAGTATALRAVELDPSGDQATAIIPGGLTPGDYDLILVNPDGEVDVLSSGVTVTANEPPVITSIVPASVIPTGAAALTISGAGFDTATTPMVELECDNGSTLVASSVATPDAGTANITVNTSSLAAGDVCIARLTNPDGAFYEFSAVSITNSSLNLANWTGGTALTTGRRDLVAVAGRPTDTSRFLYAIGGDDGVANMPTAMGPTVFDSVEAAPVDVFGNLGTWTEQRHALPAPRTAAGGARIGRFMYLVGGHDGTGATDTLFRAQVLDPLATPDVEDLDAVLGDLDEGGSSGLGGGLYYYRIAAVFPAGDAANPDGESLPGEALPVQLPDRAEGIVLTLTWEEIAGASGYRIYRSPAAGDTVDQVELLGEVTCGMGNCDCTPNVDGWLDQCVLDDDGSVATTAAEVPLPNGSLGTWHTIDGARCSDANCELTAAREGLATVAVRDRLEADAATDTWYLYAFGGRDGTGTYLDSFEVATVTVTLATSTAPESQTVADWAAGANAFISPRADHAAWVMNAENSALIRGSGSPDEIWIYVGGGRTTGGGTGAGSGSLAAALVQGDGNLGAWIADGDATGLVGLGAGASNDQLYTFGGTGSSDGTSAALCSSPAAAGMGGCAGGITDPPDLQNFNSLGSAATDRMFMGYAQESAFFFLCGGHDGNATLSSTQQTVQ
jgi:hypothetical protein